MTTSSLPPSTSFTKVGISDSATAPTSQNQLVTIAPHHRRGSSRRNLSRPPVEASTFFWIVRPGAASPVRGMNRLAPQHMSENTIISEREPGRVAAVLGRDAADDGAEQDGDEGRALDQRVAGGQFRALQVVGEDAVLDRPEQRGDDAEQEQSEEQDRDRSGGRNPSTAISATPISANLMRCAIKALSYRSAISPPSADRKK